MTDTPIPNGATHVGEFYGHITYYKETFYEHMNQAMQEYQTLRTWYEFDKDKWIEIKRGDGFSSRMLKRL